MGNMTRTPQILMQRTLHPVGQGAFYTEQFLKTDNNFNKSVLCNLVFDCGSQDSNVLERTINYMFPKNKAQIDLLFLSHFHDDHVNGMEYLGQRVEKINCVAMPLLKPSQKVMAFLSCNINLFDIQSFKRTYKINKVIFIERVETSFLGFDPSSRNQRPNLNNTNSQAGGVINIEDLRDSEIVSSGTSLGLDRIPKRKKTPEWTFIPFNICEDSEYTEFKTYLESKDSDLAEKLKKLIEDRNIPKSSDIPTKEFLSDWDEIKTRLKNIYDRYIKEESEEFSKFNDSSMIVYSGPINNNIKSRTGGWSIKSIMNRGIINKITRKQEKVDKRVAALYTGDINFNKIISSSEVYDYFCKKLNDYVENLGLIQVPHHGSKHNFTTGLAATFPKAHFYFYSFGLENSYGHPFPGVRMWLQCDGKKVFEITEDYDTKLIQNIEI